MSSDDRRQELANQRREIVTTEHTHRAAWAAMPDATSTDVLADHLIKKLTRGQPRAIVSEWTTPQDFVLAMNGVESDEDEGEA